MPVLKLPRRQEFAAADLETAERILDGSRYAHLANRSGDELELRPLNFVRLGRTVYFHTAPQGSLAARVGEPVILCAQSLISWIPSYWRHPELACPATTFYASVCVRGLLYAVDDLARKAEVLQAFMERYQAEGGYLPIRADESRYQGPLRALTVLALDLEQVSAKCKFGQHLSSGARREVFAGLLKRGDWECARAMQAVAPELTVVPEGRVWTDDPLSICPAQVYELLKQTYWGHRRSVDIVTANLEAARLNLALLENGRVLAYGRAAEVVADTGWLFDVVVDPKLRGEGIGTELISRILGHPAIAGLRRVLLDTRDAMAFYTRFGFREVARGESPPRSLMLRGTV